MVRMPAGPLILVGGAEFLPGNEPHDRLFADAAAGPAYVIATAAVRQDPDRAVATARRWFSGLGLEVTELRLRGRRDAADPSTVEAARAGRGFYLCGGDPGLIVKLLAGTPAWDAVVDAWRIGGAALAGSSAGAMALGEWTLIRAGMSHARRRFAPALAILPGVAVVPHFEEFGEGWLPSIDAAERGAVLLGLDTRTAAVWRPRLGWVAEGAGRVTVIGNDGRVERTAGEPLANLPDVSRT
jgi:cyanophycinase